MDKDIDTSLDTLQQRLLEEVGMQQRLRKELKTTLENERDLRLENELLWVYLQRIYPGRVRNAVALRDRLLGGSDLSEELEREAAATKEKENPTMRQRTRRVLGKMPGVRQIYHGIKNSRKR